MKRLSFRLVLLGLCAIVLCFGGQGLAWGQTNSTWNGGTGNWNTAGNWTPGTVPNNGGSTYNVTIDSGGTDVVTLNISPTINLLNLGGASGGSAYLEDASGSPETLTITGALTVNATGELSLGYGSTVSAGSVANTGNIDLQGGSSLSVSGNLTNSGTVLTDYYCCSTNSSLTVTGSFTNNAGANFYVGLNNASTDVDSVGTLVNSGYLYVGTGATLKLTNQANGITDVAAGSLISDSGTISAGANNAFYKLASIEGELQLENGKSTADTATTLTIAGGGFLDLQNGSSFSVANVTNSGTVATDYYCCGTGSSLTVSGTFTNNADANFYVGTNNVPANDTDSVGTLVNNGNVYVGNGSTLNLTNQVNGITDVVAGSLISNSGTISAGANNAFYKLASIEGELQLANGKSTADTATTLTISSTGFLDLQNSASFSVANITNSGTVATDYYCCGTGSSLTVSGTFTNNAGANFYVGTNNVPANDTDSVGMLVNNGNVYVGIGSTLNLSNQVNGITDIGAGSLISNSGTISAGANNGFYKLASIEGELQLANGKSTADTVTTLTISSSGVLDIQSGTSFSVANITNSGNVFTDYYCCGSGSSLTVSGTFTNNANANFYVGTNNVPANDTDSVGTLVNNGNVYVGTGSTLNLTNQPNGITDIGAGSLISNAGTISAGANNGFYELASIEGELQLANGKSTADTVTTLTVSGTGVLDIQSGSSLSVANITNSGNVYTDYYCCGTGSSLTVSGTFTNNSGANFDVGTNNVPANDTDSVGTLTNSGTVSVGNGSTLEISKAGTLTNTGTINIGSGLGGGKLEIEANVSLSGAGKVILSDEASNIIEGASSSDVLTVVKGQTIEGSGNIGNNSMGLSNAGVIDADQSVPLIIQISSGSTNSNSGTLEATAGATLQLDAGTYSQTSTGAIVASETGNALSTVLLESGTTIKGGKITITGTTAAVELNSGSLTLNGISLSGTGKLQLADGTTTTLLGSNTSTGTIDLNSTGDVTEIVVGASAVTLGGTGKVILSTNANNIITGAASTDVLTSANTIEGAGNIGDGNMGLVNTGTILADTTTLLEIDASSAGFNNEGTLTVDKSDTLYINNTSNQFLNFNSGTGTLTGGIYVVDGILKFDGASITTDAANITLSGTAAKIENQSGTNALTNLNTIAANGTFDITSGITFTTTGNFTNNGSLIVGTTSKFVVNSSFSLTNFNSGTDTLAGGTYNITGTLEFAGADIVNNDADIILSGTKAAIENSSAVNALTGFDNNESGGTFALTSKANFTTGSTFTNSGTLNIGSGSTFAVGTGGTGTLTNFSGTTLTGGTYFVTGTLQFDGANIVTNAANITMSGTTAAIKDQSGNNGLANFATNSASGSFTLASNAKFTSAGAFSNAGALAINKGSTFTVGGTNAYTQTGGSTTVDGTLTLGSGASLNISAGDLFGNGGTITGSVSATGSAIVDPGDGIGGIGDIKVSQNYTQAASAVLDIDLGGTTANTKYDVLDITDAASLNGTLNVDLVNGYAPAVNATFTILNYGSETGTFSTVNLPTVSGDHWTVTYNTKDVVIKLIAGPGPTQYVNDLTAAAPATTSAFGGAGGTPARWTRSASLLGSGAGLAHEPSAILTPAETCGGFRSLASFACITKAYSGVTAGADPAFHSSSGSGSERASATISTLHNNVAGATISTLHNNVAVASTAGSGSAARYGASQAPGTPNVRTVSAASLARLYVCAYLPSDVASTMGCR